jgi:hypothetical protein
VELALIQLARRQPYSKAVMYQHVQAIGAPVDRVGIWLAVRRLNQGRFFWPGARHGSPQRILSLIIECYPTLFFKIWINNTLNVLNITDQLLLVDETPLNPHFLALNAQEAAAAFIAAGTAADTVRSYRSALADWSA